MTGALHRVELRQLPVQVWAQAQEHTEALLREFALITTASHDEETHAVPRRLLDLIRDLDVRFAGMSRESELRDAAEAGTLVMDLTYDVPAEVLGAAEQLDVMLDEADAFCADGSHLLTLASPDEVVRFRKWFLAQFTDQIAGRPATAWPDWGRD